MFPEKLPHMEPALKPRGILHKTEEVEENQGKWCLIFPGADRTVMLRSERFRYDIEKHRPAQIQAYVQVLFIHEQFLIQRGQC